MCTIVALRRVRSDFPLVLATNRDEFYARPSAGPRRLLETPSAVGGSDLRAQGTWMGVTREGLFVGVTNQRTLRAPDPNKRSRGEIVMEALRCAEPDAIHRYVSGLDGREFNSFNLLFGDARALYAAYGRDHTRAIEIQPVPEGVHVLPNDRLDSADFWKVKHAKAWLEQAAQAPWDELVRTLESMLADGSMPALDELPDLPPGAPFDKPVLQRLAALCVRTPTYGTRSSTLVALREGEVGAYLYADGPPDQTAFLDVRGLFDVPL